MTESDKDNSKLDEHPKLDAIDSINVTNIQSKNNVISSQQPENISGIDSTESLIEEKVTSLTKKNSDGESVLINTAAKITDSTRDVDAAIDVSNIGHKKSLVHFNTPPIRNVKKRRTMDSSSFYECKILSETRCLDSTQCLKVDSNVQNLSQRSKYCIL